MRTLTSALKTEKNKLASASAWLTLVQVEINATTTIYLVANPASIVFDGNTYSPFPLELRTVASDSRGGLPDVEILVSNVDQQISTYVEANDLRGKRMRLIGVNSDNLADPAATVFDEQYEISEILVSEEVVTFRIGHSRLLEQRFPARRFLRDNCQWLYKGTECGYVGALATCDKQLEGSNGCRVHANVVRFGAFPGLPSVRGRVS